MTREAEKQIVKAIRSLPWYMFLVPALFTFFLLLFEPSVLTDTRPQLGWWDSMWIVAKAGFFVWVLRQLLRYALFHWMTQLRSAISYSPPNNVCPVTSHGFGVRESSSNVTIISRREIPRQERQTIAGRGR
ncbi:MAG: hypothetical protein ACM34E_06550 [Acidobacteriota bacterium]